jgi:hypothetical protein
MSLLLALQQLDQLSMVLFPLSRTAQHREYRASDQNADGGLLV